MVGRVVVLVTILILAQTGSLNSHQESGEWSCDSNSDIHIKAEFKPGRINLDGQVDDWKEIDGSAFSLLPALDPHSDKPYNGGKMTIKASHDGKEVFFMLQVGITHILKDTVTRLPLSLLCSKLVKMHLIIDSCTL
nr:uncharacterized protein LOC104119707 isoform X2 [Nicotiana tomentosiformis]